MVKKAIFMQKKTLYSCGINKKGYVYGFEFTNSIG